MPYPCPLSTNGIDFQEDHSASLFDSERERAQQPLPVNRGVFDDDSDPLRSIAICNQVLQNPTEQYCGMQLLAALTDASSTLLPEVERVSRFVLTDIGIQEVLMRHLMGYSDGSTPMIFHVLTLRLLAQALEHMPDIRLRRSELDWNSPFWQVALFVFHQHVNDNHTRPLEASLAIRCLRAIQVWSPSADMPMPSEATLWAAYHQGQ